jgi:flagellar basal body-associated protein FliL
MAKTPASPEEAAAGEAPKKAKGSMFGKLLVVGLIAVVVVVECVVAYLCIPAASEATAAAVKPPADRKKGESAEPNGETEGPTNMEVDLKEFSVTIFQPASNSTLRVDFHLHGTVAAEKKKEFDRLFELNQNRFREQVMVVVRSAEMADLTDPSLGLIKRTILEKSRVIFGQPLLQELIISDYSTLEN